MKNLFGWLLITILLFGCTSATKHLQNGNYDKAISKSVKKLQRKPNDIKHLTVLESAFTKGNERDREKIDFLKLEGRPDNWEQIFRLYSNMKQRQGKVKMLSFVPPNIQFSNYDEEIVKAKQKAAEYYYAHGQKLLEDGGRENARNAFYEFQNVKRYYPDFRDVDQYVSKAKDKGTSNVIFKMGNQSGIPLPDRFQEELFKITVQDLNQKWVKFYLQDKADKNFNYAIWLNLKLIKLPPERVKEVHFTEAKKIKDGWEYVLDEKGNVKKDTLGNDIKKTKMRTISCKIVETRQHKTARLSGTMDFVNTESGELIKSEPITTDALFEHSSAMAIGDVRALKPATKPIVGRTPVPFPSDGDLIMQAGGTLKKIARDLIYRHHKLFK